MLDKSIVEKKMKERGFTVYATMGKVELHFISSHMYSVSDNSDKPIINVIVNLENGNFQGLYNIKESINTLQTAKCGSVMNDEHFDKIIMKLETHAKILERFTH